MKLVITYLGHRCSVSSLLDDAGKLDLSHLPEENRKMIPVIENVMLKRGQRSPTWVAKLWALLEEDPKEALTRVEQVLCMLPQGVSFETFFKRFPALLFDENMRYLEMGETCISLMERIHHFRLGYKYGIYDMEDLLEIYSKGEVEVGLYMTFLHCCYFRLMFIGLHQKKRWNHRYK